ncbi:MULTISPECIES: ABC transporter substrate-binding protein [unclassified Azospirillum]|uniref:ABC transporter substrate-binding protein n=1 Tax=unclassified Azospirillum TaxID=2630922 RepID=UPI000D64DC9B|nr:MULTISPECIES: ABC transporter substrate-binding protein [unclassified Azospirillum]
MPLPMPSLVRRSVLAASACLPLLAAADAGAAGTPTTLRMVPQADLKFLDPMFTTNYVTRNYGYLVFDTLFGLDSHGVPKPQMVESYIRSDDGLTWSFTLRPGLAFHDGAPVRAADCVASLQRWSKRDNYGRAMMAAGAQWRVEDERRFTLTLAQPFGLVLESLAKASGMIPVIMPERTASRSGDEPSNEAIGSGPYMFKRDEWVPGSKVVFVRNPAYVGRSEPADFLSGNRAGHIERIEWLYLPDSNSATASLALGEVDMLELVPPDYIAPLRDDKTIQVRQGGAIQASMIVNHLHPPFNNPKIRQAVLHAIDQEKFLAAMGYPPDLRMKHCATFFICGGPNETSAGADAYKKPDIATAKRLLAEAGYKGEPVVVLLPTDYAVLNAAALMVIQTLKDIGMNVTTQSMDWASVVARRARKDPPGAGGWSAYATYAASFDVNSPINNFMLGSACGNSMPGWPCDETLDKLRAEWIRADKPEERRARLDAFQEQAYQTVPYIPLGQYASPYAVRNDVTNVDRLTGDVPQLWVLDKSPATQ